MCKVPALAAKAKKIAGLIKCVRYVTTQNRCQCYIFRLRIMLQVYNSSLSRLSSWFAVEKSRSLWHDRISFIVYPFPLWSWTKPPKRLSFVVGLSLFFSITTNWLPKKVVQQWSQWNGMTVESWLGSISWQHVTMCLDCHESYRPGRCQNCPQHKRNQQKYRLQKFTIIIK